MNTKQEELSNSCCRHAYFEKHDKHHQSDVELYIHFLKVVTFLDALAQQFGKKINGHFKTNMGRTHQGLYLTNSIPPAIITPWGRWFNLIVDEDNTFTEPMQRAFWKELQKYLILDKWVIGWLKESKPAALRPLIGFNDIKLPAALLGPYGECTHNDNASLKTTQDQLLKALEYQSKNSQITLKQLCLNAIQKEGLRKEKEEQEQ